jgi:branched-chain amino acid aminotransferase
MRGSKVWFNGKILPEAEARISLFTHTLHYGAGAFEGIRCYEIDKGVGAVFRLREHIERLFESCKILNLNIPFELEAVIQASKDICKANQMSECYIRPLVFIGDGPTGVNPGPNPPIDIAILNWKWGNYLGDDVMKGGVKIRTSSFVRPHPNSIMTKGKIIGQYSTGVLAKREATGMGYHEALFLDTEGYVAEGSGENIFMIKNGIVKTTSLTTILSGITRDTVMTYFRENGYKVVETRFTRDELWCADEVFFCGTAAEITPIAEIDGRTIGRVGKPAQTPGPITLKLRTDYHEIVRGKQKPAYAKTWLDRL